MPLISAVAVAVDDVAVGQTCFQRIEIVPTQVGTKTEREEGSKTVDAYLYQRQCERLEQSYKSKELERQDSSARTCRGFT